MISRMFSLDSGAVVRWGWLVVALTVVGCSQPSVRQQRWVSRSNMTFEDSPVASFHSSKLLPQLETGYAGAGGAANAGCTSCR